MEWRAEGLLLSVTRHGENAAIIEVFTAEQGRHAGIVRGGASRKMAPILQPGAQLDLNWRARLEEHLGSFTVEPLRSRAGLMSDRKALAGLNAISALLRYTLAERDPHPALYARTCDLVQRLEEDEDWPYAYLLWEMALLEEVGFGLDLTTCAVTGVSEGLAFVSPKTGRAVSEAGAGEWAARLLPFSPVLLGKAGDQAALMDAFRVTGHFLDTRLPGVLLDKPLPNARARLIDLLGRAT